MIAKKVLEAAKLAYAKKIESITSQKLGCQGFLQIANSVLNIGKSVWTAQMCCILHPIKQNCLLKTFLGTLIWMTHLFLYLFVFLELI